MGNLARYMNDRDKLVVKANELIQKSRFSLSMQQQKIVLYLISQINYEDEDFKEYEFDIQDFCRVCGIDHTSGKNYDDLKEQIKAIRDQSIWGLTIGGEETTLAWIEKPYINRGSGKIRIRLDRDMKPFLLQLRQNFTKYEIVNILAMKSKYSIRLYELVKSIHFHEMEEYKRVYTIGELRQLLDADKYPRFGNFNQRVLKPAVQEVNTYTDKVVSSNPILKGRKAEAVELTIRTKDVIDRLKTRTMIDERLGPVQLTLWDNNGDGTGE